jgi:hypothetical protein
VSKTTVATGGIADDAVGNTKLDLTANYAFTGTISGLGLYLMQHHIIFLVLIITNKKQTQQ